MLPSSLSDGFGRGDPVVGGQRPGRCVRTVGAAIAAPAAPPARMRRPRLSRWSWRSMDGCASVLQNSWNGLGLRQLNAADRGQAQCDLAVTVGCRDHVYPVLSGECG